MQGNIQETRIIADHSAETKWGGPLTWKAEYRVVYFAATREHATKRKRADVRLALLQSHPSCRVKYNPQRPEESVAHCR